MKCDKCGLDVENTGYLDKNGTELFIGDVVFIRWADIYSAMARICSFRDVSSDFMTLVPDKAPSHPEIVLEMGSIRINGEIADFIHQGMYILRRPMRDSKMCILLYRPIKQEESTHGTDSR